ncbi:NAC domain-containing protein [Drosera capensis]
MYVDQLDFKLRTSASYVGDNTSRASETVPLLHSHKYAIKFEKRGADGIRKSVPSICQCSTWLGTCKPKVRCGSCLAMAVAWQVGHGTTCKSLLPSKDLEWYFFSPRDRKFPNGSRTNRATKAGYWKATGKDRNVNSQLRAIGTKNTLVYHRGRAPYGSRTGWVMHEYRLHERECLVPSGLQDAYALCRVFKKTNPVMPKHESRFVLKNVSRMSSNGPSSTEIYSGGKFDGWDSSEYSIPVEGCSTSINPGPPLHDDQWMQYLANDEEEFSFGTSPLNNGPTAYCSSKVKLRSLLLDQVDFAQCARLRHYPTHPAMLTTQFKMQQSPSFIGGLGNEVDVMEEIFSVSPASQDLINQSEANSMFAYAWNDNHQEAIFSGMDPWEDPMAKPIEVHDAGDYQSVVNYSELVILPENISYEKIDDPECNAIPAENVPAYQLLSENVQGEVGNEIYMSYLDDIKADDFHLQFLMDDPSKNSEPCGDNGVDSGFPCSSNFELLQKVEVNQGSRVSTQGLAETRFHQLLPSTTVRVHLLLQPRSQRDEDYYNMKHTGCLSSSICHFQGRFKMSTKEEIQVQSEQGMSEGKGEFGKPLIALKAVEC